MARRPQPARRPPPPGGPRRAAPPGTPRGPVPADPAAPAGRRPPPPGSTLERVAGDPSVVLLPLRAFLGVTFCFAGLQKLANPNFFRSASPISIHAQLVAAARTSPLRGLLHHLASISTLLGLVIAVGELAIGLGVLAGVLTRAAAIGGMLLSLGLFLTVSFHSSPYYTGADIVFLFAFMPLLIAGPGRFTAMAAVEQIALRYQAPSLDALAVDEDRRRVVVTGALGAAGLVLAGLAAGLGRAAGGARAPRPGPSLSLGGSTPTTAPASPSTTASPGPSTPTTAAGTPKGTRIGPASDVPVGGAASFQDPSSGDPAVVIQASAGQFKAFDAVCPHAGCTVGYSSSQKVLICPCHGSLFNPADGAVETGPAASGLRTIRITKGPDGQLYVE